MIEISKQDLKLHISQSINMFKLKNSFESSAFNQEIKYGKVNYVLYNLLSYIAGFYNLIVLTPILLSLLLVWSVLVILGGGFFSLVNILEDKIKDNEEAKHYRNITKYRKNIFVFEENKHD